jgi:cell wall assembly regulator SMI1
MPKSLTEILEKFNSNGPSLVETMEAVEKDWGILLPLDYKNFMSTHDGGEGFVGEQYLILWRAGELLEFNRDYEVEKYSPGLVLFGSNGGGEAFAFDARPGENMRIRIVPFIGMSLGDAKYVAESFEKFLFRLGEHHGSLL